MRRTLAALSLVVLACGKSNTLTCDEEMRKGDVEALAYSYYLYLDLLPPTFAGSAYPSAGAVLNALTLTAQQQGKDRGWSFLMPQAQFIQYFQEAQSVGYGVSLLTTGAAPSLRVFVKQVFAAPGAESAADRVGFRRGDEILAAGPDASSMTAVAGLTPEEVSTLLSAGGATGVSKAVQVQPVDGSAQVVRTMVSAAFGLDPVPSYQVFGTTGYVQLRSFVSAAEDPLRTAFVFFKSQGVQSVVVDLRYNGGGSIDTALVLADLLGQGLVGKQMFQLQPNGNFAALTASFGSEADGGSFQRVAFITTSATASASELVANALDAYPSVVPIAYVGAETYGKPVGQRVFDLPGCSTELFLVSYRLINAAGVTDYYGGLPAAPQNGIPGSYGPLCGAADDLTHAQDSPDESSTAAAVYFAQNGSCPPAPAAAARARAAGGPIDQLGASARTFAQRDMPGTF